jgi:hypothetical protein
VVCVGSHRDINLARGGLRERCEHLLDEIERVLLLGSDVEEGFKMRLLICDDLLGHRIVLRRKEEKYQERQDSGRGGRRKYQRPQVREIARFAIRVSGFS